MLMISCRDGSGYGNGVGSQVHVDTAGWHKERQQMNKRRRMARIAATRVFYWRGPLQCTLALIRNSSSQNAKNTPTRQPPKHKTRSTRKERRCCCPAIGLSVDEGPVWTRSLNASAAWAVWRNKGSKMRWSWRKLGLAEAWVVIVIYNVLMQFTALNHA